LSWLENSAEERRRNWLDLTGEEARKEEGINIIKSLIVLLLFTWCLDNKWEDEM
jgi:hypothetical protein